MSDSMMIHLKWIVRQFIADAIAGGDRSEDDRYGAGSLNANLHAIKAVRVRIIIDRFPFPGPDGWAKFQELVLSAWPDVKGSYAADRYQPYDFDSGVNRVLAKLADAEPTDAGKAFWSEMTIWTPKTSAVKVCVGCGRSIWFERPATGLEQRWGHADNSPACES